MRIGDREIGPGKPPYVIAEIGVNHDGIPARALDLVDAAAKSGADAVKCQLFEATRLMSSRSSLAGYQEAAGETNPTEMLRRLELSVDAMAPAVDRAHALRMHAIVTVFSVELVEKARVLAWDAYKTASPDIVNKPLLDELMGCGRPLIVSTGAADLEEIRRALDWSRSCWNRMAVLQCVSAYPTPPEFAALPAMSDLAEVFRGPVGYSDHTEAVDTGALAVRVGACILEKHLTYDRTARGPDHAASLDPAQFKQYVDAARAASQGTTRIDVADARLAVRRKHVQEIECDVRRVSRQSVVAAKRIARGQLINRSDLTLKRPGVGVPPYMLSELIGRAATRDIPSDEPLMMEDVANMALWSAA